MEWLCKHLRHSLWKVVYKLIVWWYNHIIGLKARYISKLFKGCKPGFRENLWIFKF